jgi:hypothetical protein
MKKIMFALIFGILLVGIISAFDWTDYTITHYYSSENATMVDNVNFNYNGTNSGTTDIGGRIDQARYYDGSDLYNFTQEDYTASVFYSFWLMTNRSGLPTGDGDVIYEKENGATELEWISLLGDEIKYWFDGDAFGQSRFVTSGANLLNNTWYHIVVNGTGGFYTIWVNGVNQSVTIEAYAGDRPSGTTDNFQIGGGTLLAKYTQGRIDEFLIKNTTGSVQDVEDLYNNNAGLGYGIDITGEVSVTLNSPTNDSQENDDPITFNATVTPQTFTKTNATINIWFSNGTIWKTQTNTSFDANFTTFNVSDFVIESYLWSVLGVQGNGNGTNSSWADDNFTLEFIPFEVSGEQYVNETYETDNETFYINITTDSTVSNIGVFLNYNATQYPADHSCSSGLCQIEATIDVPLVNNQNAVDENKTWFWQITLFGDEFGTFATNTSSHEQNVTNIAIMNSTFPLGINFTIHNETNLSYQQIADFKSTMTYYLGGGSVTENYNFSGVGLQTYSFNLSHNLSFYTTSEIEIINGTTEREYYFANDILTNTTTNRSLFIPDTSFSNIIIEVKDQGLIPMDGVIVNVSRYYPDTDTYEQVENQQTDEFGQFVAKLVQNDVKYRFAFYRNGALLKTSDRISIACRTTICIVPFVIETEDGYFDRFENISLFSYSLSFDNTTNTFTYSWDDQTGDSATHRLEVRRFNLNQSTIVCNSTSTATVASLTCAVGGSSATYRAQVFRLVNGDNERRVSILNIVVGSPVSTYGVEGLLWAFVLLFTCIGIGAFNPTAGAILYGVGFVFLGILGIISMPLGVFFANTLIVGLFVWAVNT